ncbi:EAL domain-containing response regulator [Pseudoalteromonas piscicida]|uniref:GGDEF/EAL domain-containing response regulator n=1 Tax=Pseudoalteromonas piscicida TaxID=43662 RepID=UPI00309970E3
MNAPIMLVDDEIDILKSLKRTLKLRGYDVVYTEDPQHAIDLINEHQPHVLITDFRMPSMNGQQLIQEVKRHNPNIECIVLSGQADYDDMKALINANNTFKFISKPWDSEELYATIEAALTNFHKNELKAQILRSNNAPLVEINTLGNVIDCNYAYTELVVNEGNKGNFFQLFNFENSKKIEDFAERSIATLNSSGTLCQVELKLKTESSYLLIIKPLLSEQDQYPNFYQSKQRFIEHIKPSHNAVMICLKIRDLLVKNIISNTPIYSETFKKVIDHATFKASSRFSMLEISFDQAIFYLDAVQNEIEVHKFLDEVIHSIRQFFIRKNIQIKFSVSYTMIEPQQQLSEVIDSLVIYTQFVSESRTDFYMRYSPSLLSEKLNEHKVSEALFNAVDNDEFYLRFQPKLSLPKQSIDSCEVLIRWKNTEFGANSPDYFIPIAEKDGQIVKIGTWVIAQSCIALCEWRNKGLEVNKVAINVSPYQLADPNFVEVMCSILNEHNVRPEQFELEITENFVLENLEQARSKILHLKELGFSIAIDDFGTGYSSLGYISKLPVDVIKIDKSLVENIDSSKSARDLIQNVVRLVHDLDLKVVAEGIETVEQLEVLEKLKCDQVQGYLIGKPVSLEEFMHYVY